MTIEQVIQVVEDETRQKVTADTEMESLGLDSLETLDLLLKLDVPAMAAMEFRTVGDIARYAEAGN